MCKAQKSSLLALHKGIQKLIVYEVVSLFLGVDLENVESKRSTLCKNKTAFGQSSIIKK